MITYCSGGLKLQQLKAHCKARGLKVGGKKAELVGRLKNDDRQKVSRCVLLQGCSGIEKKDPGSIFFLRLFWLD
jgi:hypothetical protein